MRPRISIRGSVRPSVRPSVTRLFRIREKLILCGLTCFEFLVVTHDSIRGCVRPSVGPSVRPSVRNAFFSIGQKWVETNKNEISDDMAGRDYMSHDLFRVYELVSLILSG